MSSQQFTMKSYMKGALLLTIAAIIVKILSAAYRVPFQNIVGDQGFYVYQQVYPFVALFVTWTTGGVAVAISKMLANMPVEDGATAAKKKAIQKIIFQFLTVLSLLIFAVLFFGAPYFAHLMSDELLTKPLQVGAFVTLFMPILAILKGSFQSNGWLQPIAYSQVFEQSIRVAIILLGTMIVMKTSGSVYMAGTTAIFGTVIGELACIVFLLYFWKKTRTTNIVEKIELKKWPIIKEITLFSLSVSMSSLLLLCYQLIDSFTVFPSLLNANIAYETAQQLKGVYDRGQPFVQLGLVIATSLSLAIVPLIAFKQAQKSKRGALPFVRLTYKASLIFGVAAAFGLVAVMPYMNKALFMTDLLSDTLAIYSLQIIPLSIILTVTAILQGYNKLLVPSCIIIVSIVLKLIGNHFLIPYYLLNGVAWTSLLSLVICAGALIYYLRKIIMQSLAPLIFYVQLSLSVIAMLVTIKIVEIGVLQLLPQGELSRMYVLLLALCFIIIGAFTFITIVAKFRLLKEKEWFVIPFGKKMATYQLWLNRKRK